MTRDIESERNNLLVRVARGEVTPEDAEAEAKREKLGPLAGVRDPERFDPHREDRWTNPMTVSWIRWFDTERVRFQMEGYRAELKTWERRGPGYVLERLPKAQITKLQLDQDGEDFSYFADAVKDLWTRLKNSDLAAVGIDPKTSRPVKIPTAEWVYLTLWGEDTRPNSVAVPPTIRLRGYHRRLPREMQKIRYDDITVSREDVLRLWPGPEPATRQATPHEAALRAFLRARHPEFLNVHTPRPRGTIARLAADYGPWAALAVNHQWPRTMTAQFIGQTLTAWAEDAKRKK